VVKNEPRRCCVPQGTVLRAAMGTKQAIGRSRGGRQYEDHAIADASRLFSSFLTGGEHRLSVANA